MTTTTNIKLTALSTLGLAIETTPGTPVAATGFLPVLSFKPQDDPKYLPDQGKRGQPVDLFGEYLSVESATYELEGDFFPTSGGNLVAAWLGQDTVTGSATPYTHTMTGVAIPPSYTITDYYVANTRQWAGAKSDKLTLKYNADAALTYTSHWITWLSATGTQPTASYSQDAYLQGWEATCSIGGTTVSNLESATITLTRKGSKAAFAANNSQSPFNIFVGPMEATWALTFYMLDDTEYLDALSQGTKIVTVEFTQGGTSDTVTFTSSAVQFTKPTINRGNEMVMVEVEGSAVYNSTDSGIFQCVIKNEVSTSYTTQAAS